jgi:hypothetical protein
VSQNFQPSDTIILKDKTTAIPKNQTMEQKDTANSLRRMATQKINAVLEEK